MLQAIPAHRQRGAVILLLLITLAIGAATYLLVKRLNSSALNSARDNATSASLAEAKDALLGYTLKRQDPERPGDFPCPDNSSDGDYDGTQDAPCGNTNPGLRLGRLPWRSSPPVTDGLNADLVDGSGERLWYAVSRNLVDPAGVAALNTSLLVAAPHPWISVRDRSGNIISNRVAAVIIAPGPALDIQSRGGNTPPPAQFLDEVTLGAITYRNRDSNDCLDDTTCPTVASRNGEDFILAEPSPTFNDRLQYLSVDELFNRLVDRVAGEIRQRLDQFHQVHGDYPVTFGVLGGWPQWFTDNWQAVTAYTQVAPHQATIQFSSCASVFTVTWDTLTNRSRMQRTHQC